MKLPSRFIVIDDDLINNTLCRMIIKGVTKETEIQTFNVPEVGFAYITNEYATNEVDEPTILFLDINMPSWTGWDFLDNFDALDEKIKRQIKIYMLTSSVDPNDKEKAIANRNVVEYIVKPLNGKIVSEIISKNQ